MYSDIVFRETELYYLEFSYNTFHNKHMFLVQMRTFVKKNISSIKEGE